MKKLIIAFSLVSFLINGPILKHLDAQQAIFLTSSAKRGTGKEPKWPCGETREDSIQMIQNYWQEIQFVPPYDYCDNIAVCFQVDTIGNTPVAILDIPFRLNDSAYNFMSLVASGDSNFGIKIFPKDQFGQLLNLISITDISQINHPQIIPDANGWYDIVEYDTTKKIWLGFPQLIIDLTNFAAPSMVIDVDFLLGYKPHQDSSSYLEFLTSQKVMGGPPCLFPNPMDNNADNNLRLKNSNNWKNIAVSSVSPNPVEDRFLIKFNEKIQETVSIEFLDLNGKLLFKKVINPKEVNDSIEVTINEKYHIKQGIYFLKVSGNSIQNVHKIVKL